MTETRQTNPAEIAAQKALDEMYECIRARQNFRLEAGAGAGKTYSLDKALRLIINEQGILLLQKSQRVACITYTNVAINEIIERTDGHPAVHASTIHSFCGKKTDSISVAGVIQLREPTTTAGPSR